MALAWEERFVDMALTMKPSDYWRRQCKATFQFDRMGTRMIDEMGAESMLCAFFFQAEDGIRDLTVTGVQTCALPILRVLRVGQHAAAGPRHGRARHRVAQAPEEIAPGDRLADRGLDVARLARADGVHGQIGRASCRERV